jgi:primosomal protein N'
MYAAIILPLSLPKVYTYAIPESFQENIKVGMRV